MIEYFISSTFRDMQAERDVLHNLVLPEIKRYANERGEDFEFMDLRWGINTGKENPNENMAKVLSVCLRDVERCQPQMIVLIGDRYGSVPNDETLNRFMAHSTNGIYNESDLKNRSVTEIEILHGILRHPENSDNIIICIREPLEYDTLPTTAQTIYMSSTKDEQKKLTELKEMLISKYPNNILFYSSTWDEQKQCIAGLDAFVQQITTRLKENVDNIIPRDPLCEEEKHCNIQEMFFSSARKRFYGRNRILEHFDEFMSDEGKNLFVLRGICGMGKSYLCSQITELYRDEYYVIPILISYGGSYINALQLMKQVVWIAEELCGEGKHFNSCIHTYEEWRTETRRLIKVLSEQRRVLIVIDDIDKLYLDEHKDTWDYLPFYNNKQVKVFVTAQNGYKLPANSKVNYRTLYSELGGLEDGEIKHSILRSLDAMHKELPIYVIDALLRASKYHSPYYLDILMYKLANLSETDFIKINEQLIHNSDSNENLYRYIEKIVSETPGTEKDALRTCLEDVLSLFPVTRSSRVLNWIRYTMHGLRLNDIYHLFDNDVMMVDISRFIHMTRIVLQYDDEGRIFFCNEIATNAVEDYLKDMLSDDNIAKMELLHYMENLANDDLLKVNEFAPMCLLCNSPEPIARYISEMYLQDETKKRTLYSDNFTYEKIIASIRNTGNYSKYKDVDICAFMLEMIDLASNFTPEECYGFVSAILFSYDLLFDSFCDKDKEKIMLKLYDLTITKIYPLCSCNVRYLRTVYVCCEQCGIRTTDFQIQRRMYEGFLRFCLEMEKRVPSDYEYINYVFHDLSIAYEKNADAGYMSHTGNAMKIFDKSVEYAEKISQAFPYYDTLKHRKYDVILARASAVIDFEMRLRNGSNGCGFWDEERLRMVVNELQDLLIYFEKESQSLNMKRKLRQIYFQLANGNRCFDKYEEEYRWLLCMYNISKEICAESDSVLDLDQFRLVLMRLGSCQNISISYEQKINWLAEAMDCLDEIFSSSPHHNDNMLKIMFYVADVYFKESWGYVKSRDIKIADGIMSGEYTAIEISEIASAILEIQKRLTPAKMKLIVSAPVEDELDNFYNSFMQFLPVAKKYQDMLRFLSVEAYKDRDYKSAIRFGEFALKMCKFQEGYLNTENLISERLDIYDLLYVCYHNWTNNLSDDIEFKTNCSLEYDRLWNMRWYYSQMIINDCKLYDALYPDNTITLPYKKKTVHQYSDFDGLHHAVAWTNLLCYNIAILDRETECGLFWETVEKNNYYISGQKYHYTHFDVTENTYYQSDDDFSILSPQKIIMAGKYLCEHITEERVMKLLYLSDWFETLALEYAYSHDMPDVAKKIIKNGYDRYLELSLLYILRKYNRSEYDRQMKDLKLVCHQHNLSVIKKRFKYAKECSKRNMFFDEYVLEAKKIIDESKYWDKDDPRYKNCRSNIVFKYVE